MKDRLKEMNEWLDEMREGEELKVTETEDPVKVKSFFVFLAENHNCLVTEKINLDLVLNFTGE